MVTVTLKGVHIVKAKSGKQYHYAWRNGGPLLKGEPGSAEYIASYNEAIASRGAGDRTRFKSVITAYRASPDFKNLAASTRRNWLRWLDRIADHFGDLRTAQFDRTEKIRPFIRQWRAGYAETPRAADYGMQVLSRVLSYAVDPLGRISANPCDGIKHLYKGSRADIIWLADDIAQLRASASAQVMHAVDLAATCGLRPGDLFRLSWSHVGPDAIEISTGKSRHRRHSIIPLYDELRSVLERVPRVSPVVLTNSRGKPWTVDGFNSSLATAMHRAGMTGRDLHFYDLRGTAATRFYLAGIDMRTIAEIMAWEEENVERIIRRYVSRQAAIRQTIRLMAEAKTRT